MMTRTQTVASTRYMAGTVGGIAACMHMMIAGVWAQGPGVKRERELRPCVLPPQRPYVGDSLWNANLWPDGIVPYEFDANAASYWQTRMLEAMNSLEAVANLRFVPRTGQVNYVHIQDDSMNYSGVGMSGSGQTIGIYNWDYGVLCHELMHTLGVWHEQARPDRGSYVVINYNNICQTCCFGGSCDSQFDIVIGATPVGPYDFDSIMHYGRNAFSSNGQPTIVVLPPNQGWQNLIGQLTHLSTGDMAGLVSRYGAPTWNGINWTQRSVSGPSPRSNHTMAYDAARDVTVLFGGWAGSYDAETWEWNGTAWTERVVGGPSARYGHAMAYDAPRGVTVLFGGYTASGVNGETWEWNGIAWSRRFVSGPSPRGEHAMTYDAARSAIFLFGGQNGSGVINGETWEWNGTAWTQGVGGGPSARFGHSMTYDRPRGVTVLFGGVTESGHSGETWERDVTGWTQRVVGSPSPRSGHSMAYDAARAVTVLFGGLDSTPYFGDTWEWDGTAWTHRGLSAPRSRSGHAMAYDAARGVTALFGGITDIYQGDTWEYGAPCYANCDVSSGAPPLTANDFTCFLNRYVANNPYANCDMSTGAPTHTANDFLCFINAFAAGCP